MLLDQRDRDGCYPIHYASHGGQVNVLTTLIRHGAEIIKKTNQRQSSLHLAAQYVLTTLYLITSSFSLDMVDTIPVGNCWTHQDSNASLMSQIILVEHHFISVVKMDTIELFSYFFTKLHSWARAIMETHHFMKQLVILNGLIFFCRDQPNLSSMQMVAHSLTQPSWRNKSMFVWLWSLMNGNLHPHDHLFYFCGIDGKNH